MAPKFYFVLLASRNSYFMFTRGKSRFMKANSQCYHIVRWSGSQLLHILFSYSEMWFTFQHYIQAKEIDRLGTKENWALSWQKSSYGFR